MRFLKKQMCFFLAVCCAFVCGATAVTHAQTKLFTDPSDYLNDPQITSTGTFAVVLIDETRGTKYPKGLYSVATDGTKAPVKLLDLTKFGYIGRDAYKLSPDGRSVIIVIETNGSVRDEIYSAQIDRANSGKRISTANLPANCRACGTTGGFAISPDNSTVIFNGNRQLATDDASRSYYYSVPIGGGTIVNLTKSVDAGGDFLGSAFTSDGKRLLLNYLIYDRNFNYTQQIYSVLLSNGAAVKLFDKTPINFNFNDDKGNPVQDGSIIKGTKDGQKVVFALTDENGANKGLVLASVTNPKDQTTLTVSTDRLQQYKVVPEINTVIYTTNTGDGTPSTFTFVPFDYPSYRYSYAPKYTQNGVTQGLNVTDFQYSLTLRGIVAKTNVFDTATFASANDLYSFVISDKGTLVVTRFTPGTYPQYTSGVTAFKISPDGSRVVYSSKQDGKQPYVESLYSVNTATNKTVKVTTVPAGFGNPSNPQDFSVGANVSSFDITADSKYLVYGYIVQADDPNDPNGGKYSATSYSADLVANKPGVLLNKDSQRYQLAAAVDRALYTTRSLDFVYYTLFSTDLTKVK